MDKIIWIVDNPYGEKFTATRADSNVTSDITREEAKAMLGADGVWMSAKAEVQCKAIRCAREEKQALEYSVPGQVHMSMWRPSMPGVAKQEYTYSFWN